MKSEELVNLYSKMDEELKRELLSGEAWDQVKYKVDTITEISKELTKRNISFKQASPTPADSPIRNEEN